ncbi:glycosyltransferase family 2 protein [Gordoniibacillus kamchatkensis]|nr:glycosyltransferase family 2 protein [Paenibacillus sp. VKM B-2647]
MEAAAMPTVSVIIPTHNRPGPLAELLEALLRQRYEKLEVIVVNDAGESVDDVCALYPELDVRIVNMETNVMHVHARNAGLAQASGEFVMLCDDDDLIVPGHIQRMMAAIEDCDLVYTDVEMFDYRYENGTRIPVSRFLFAYEYDREAMKRFSTFVASGCLYRRSVHDAIGPFDVDMFHYWDWDFFLTVSARFRVKRLPVASGLYAFSQQGDNMSGNHDSMRPYLDKLCEKHGLGYLPTKNFFLLLEEPEVRSRQAKSEIVWDFQPVVSRLASYSK